MLAHRRGGTETDKIEAVSAGERDPDLRRLLGGWR